MGCFGFFFLSGSRVFLLGFLVGFGLGPLGYFWVFFFFFLFFVLALAARVYPRCTLGRLTLFNKLTYLSKKKWLSLRAYLMTLK